MFIVYKQAYDTFIRREIYEALDELSAPKKMINLVKVSLYQAFEKVY